MQRGPRWTLKKSSVHYKFILKNIYFFFLQTWCYSNDMSHSQYERGLFSWCLVTVKLFIAVHPRSRWQLYKKSKTQSLVWLLARKFTRTVFLDSSKSKANDLENGFASYSFLLAGLSFIMYNYKIQAQQNKILLPVPHSADFFFS